MSTESVIALLAGGFGKRLWPLSSKDRPKQFLPLFSGRSMLQRTFERAATVVGEESIYLIGNVRHEAMYRTQLPNLKPENLILEPAQRGTAAAVALAAVVCSDLAPGAVVATIPSDHLISNPEQWTNALRTAFSFAADHDYIVCLGTTPQAGETKFGYMVLDDTVGGTPRHPVKTVKQFIEKPDADTLESLMSETHCVRNMGMLAFRPDVMAQAMKRLIPDTINPIASGLSNSGGSLAAAYEDLPVRSVDEAILQYADNVVVALGEITSNDAGDFVTLGDAVGRDEQGSAIVGTGVAVDSRNNTVFAENVTVALVGVSDLVVVVEGDKILVCPAGETQRIKQIPDNS